MHEYNENLFKKIIGLFLDEKLSFLEHTDVKKESIIGVSLMHKLNLLLLRSPLLSVL